VHFVVFGHVGSDAGYWVIGPDGKIHHVGGWNPEGIAEIAGALSIIREAARFRNQDLAQTAVKSVLEFAQRELTSQLGQEFKEGGVLVVG
jgi:RimJ/RimL family protein N-acetyltransferase